MLRIHRSFGLALFAAAFVAACDETSAPATDDLTVNDDVLAYVADVTGDDIIFMTTFADPVFGSGAAAAAGPGDWNRGHMQGPPFDGNVTFTREVTFYDSTGAVMDAYDPLLTESVRIVTSLEGSRSRTGRHGTMEMTISRSRDFTVSGLLGEETQRTWNGTGSSNTNRVRTTDDNGLREYDMSMSTAVADVVIPVPRGSGWPLSGTITRDVTIQVVTGLNDTGTRQRTVTVTFNGTQFVPITINDRSCTLDLMTKEVTCESGTS